jgi:hypothetical protein
VDEQLLLAQCRWLSEVQGSKAESKEASSDACLTIDFKQ